MSFKKLAEKPKAISILIFGILTLISVIISWINHGFSIWWAIGGISFVIFLILIGKNIFN